MGMRGKAITYATKTRRVVITNIKIVENIAYLTASNRSRIAYAALRYRP